MCAIAGQTGSRAPFLVRRLRLARLFRDASYAAPSILAASSVPTTRDRILLNAVSRERDESSLKGANPQSSVVPKRSSEMYSAASRIRSLTSSGVSTRGSTGSITPTKMRCSSLANSRITGLINGGFVQRDVEMISRLRDRDPASSRLRCVRRIECRDRVAHPHDLSISIAASTSALRQGSGASSDGNVFMLGGSAI
jgi:hypothetical protein